MIETTLIYGITFAISLIFCRIYEKVNKNASNIKKILLILGIVFPPILISTIRYGIGTDYFEYMHYYDIIRKNMSISFIWEFFSREPLYVIFTYLGHLLSGAIGINFIFACLYIFFMFQAIVYFKDKISISLALFILYLSQYLMSFNILRQMIAVAIVCFAFRYAFEKKIVKYIFWVIVAGMFHKTAYVMILLYLLNFKIDSKKVNKIYYFLIILSPIILFPVQKIIILIANKFNIYQKYINMGTEFNVNFLLYVLPILVLVAIKRKQILEIDKRYEFFIRLLFLQIPLKFFGCFIAYADRLSLYTSAVQIILVPLILRTNMNINKKEFKNSKYLSRIFYKHQCKINELLAKVNIYLNNELFLKVIIILWYVLYFVVMYILLKGHEVFPYQSIFTSLKYV